MEKLLATPGCIGLNYLSTAKRSMPILNIELSGLALSIFINTEEWLLSKVLKGALSIKTVSNYIEQ